MTSLSHPALPSLGIEAVGWVWTASQTAIAAVLLATLLRPVGAVRSVCRQLEEGGAAIQR